MDRQTDGQIDGRTSSIHKPELLCNPAKNLDIDIHVIDKHTSFDSRIIVLNLKINEKCFTFLNVYAPNDAKTKHAFF